MTSTTTVQSADTTSTVTKPTVTSTSRSMIQPLVIIPARYGSRGIPHKNFRRLPDGASLLDKAVMLGRQVGHVIVSTDHPRPSRLRARSSELLIRPARLATATATTAEVMADVLRRVPGPPCQPIVLLQPSSPERTAALVRRCLRLLADGPVATVSAIPAHYWRAQPRLAHGLRLPLARQHAGPLYIFTGQVYAATRQTLERGWPDWWRPLIVPPSPNLDTMADWRDYCRSFQ